MGNQWGDVRLQGGNIDLPCDNGVAFRLDRAIWKKGRESECGRGGVSVPLTSSGPHFSSHWGHGKTPLAQQLQCPTLKMLVPSHLLKWDGVNKSNLLGFISSNSHILFHQTKETFFWMISPKRVCIHCPVIFSLNTEIKSRLCKVWWTRVRLKH